MKILNPKKLIDEGYFYEKSVDDWIKWSGIIIEAVDYWLGKGIKRGYNDGNFGYSKDLNGIIYEYEYTLNHIRMW
jgi:hypothetical protein